MAAYKVWMEVEYCDPDNDDHRSIGLPDSLGEFATQEEADEFALSLLREHAPHQIETSDRRAASVRKCGKATEE